MLKQKQQVHMRWMIRTDMREVLDIESRSFDTPWAEEDFLTCLREKNCIGMVAEIPPYDAHYHHGLVVGFMIYELHRHKLNVLNFAVHPGHRRQGVGRHMVDYLTGKLSGHRRTHITLDVRETNLTAQLAFRQVGFRACAVLRSYYDNGEDAYRMRYSLEGWEG